MKKIILIVFSIVLYFCGSPQGMPGMKMPKKESKKQTEIYTCVMHPEVQSDKPGNCPKCGMKLVKKKVKTSGTSALPKEATAPKTELKKVAPGNEEKMQMPMKKEQKMEDMPGMKDMPEMSKRGSDEKASNETPGVSVRGGGKTIRYDLYVSDTTVNYTGTNKHALAINGSLPAPTLYFTEGDTAEIYVHNTLNEETSIHWHGVILPNQYDGVPYLTTQPIKGRQTHLFKFPIIQNGTYWYHSHTKLQEQTGMYGALVFYKRNAPHTKEYTTVLSDWSDRKASEIDRSLHNQTDWFGIRKNTIQSYTEAIKQGYFKTKLANEWKRMTAMDVSDIAYDRFLNNGKPVTEQPQFKAGDKVRLRIVNGGSSTYFWLTYAGGKITVVANDGEDVEPVEVDRLIIAVAETYDVIVTIPKNMRYEFLATAEDRTKSTSIWLGSGMKMNATPLPKLKYFEGMKMMNGMMKMNGDMKMMEGMEMSNQVMDMNTVMYPEITGDTKQSGDNKMNTMPGMKKESMAGMKMDNHSGHDMTNMKMDDKSKSGNMAGMDMGNNANTDIVTLNYGMLRSPKNTTLPFGPTKVLNFELTGNMNRYVWSINNKTVSESDKILIKKGENVRIIMYNNTMMRHPMHLHGHFFRVLNGQGTHSPLKNTMDIMPMEVDTIEFAATESGDWFFHCHILYHMMSGMGRIFEYENSPPNPEVPDAKMAMHMVAMDDRMPHAMARIGIESNGSDGIAMLSNTRWQLSTLWHLGYTEMHGYESETMFGRYLGKMQWWYPYVGFDYHYKIDGGPKNLFGSEEKNLLGQFSNKMNRKTVIAGIAYTLPLLAIADARVDGNGKFRFQLSREDIPVSPRIRFNWMVNTDKEYAAGVRYIVTKYLNLSTHYDSDMGLGAGITITY